MSHKEDNLIKDSLSLMSDDGVVHIKDAAHNNGKYTTPFSVGYEIFDNAMMGGVREGDLVAVAGKAKNGKTSITRNISINLAKNGNKCLWFSYEENLNNFYAKFGNTGVNVDNLHMYSPKRMTTGNLEWIQEKIIEADEKYGCKFVFIDHLDFVLPKRLKSMEAERLIKKQICLELKELARNFNVVIFLLAHVKKVSGRNIELNDIAETSAVGQLSDFVFAVERETSEIIIAGKKTEIFGESSTLRLLANRLTGDCPYMNFTLNGNRIVEFGKVAEPMDDENDIIVEDKPLFGLKD